MRTARELTAPPHSRAPAAGAWKQAAVRELARARERSRALLAPVPEPLLVRQHSPLMSPLVWDVAHVANYEEQWLLRALGAPGLTDPAFDAVYDALRHPRSTRHALPLLSPEAAWAYADAVRARVLEHLGALREEDAAGPLLAQGFVYGMVAQHEQQHVETMLAALQLLDGWTYPLRRDAARPAPARPPQTEVFIPAGEARLGSDAAWAYDNERPTHAVRLDAFLIDAHPVTNGDFLVFVESGGYADARWWDARGFTEVQRLGWRAPEFWRREDGGRWLRRRFGHWEPLPKDEPVQHVSWYEADAYARWAGKRLPTEAEWERAAAGRSGATWPWGEAPPTPERANLGGAHWGPCPIGSFPAGASDEGVHGLVGDVWEWTASTFTPWPGFRAFPYREYSEPFFGEAFRVLRGGSWGVAPVACRASFRNWDFPIRRQIFSGFRCARDAR